jgi:hypothetical protein
MIWIRVHNHTGDSGIFKASDPFLQCRSNTLWKLKLVHHVGVFAISKGDGGIGKVVAMTSI